MKNRSVLTLTAMFLILIAFAVYGCEKPDTDAESTDVEVTEVQETPENTVAPTPEPQPTPGPEATPGPQTTPGPDGTGVNIEPGERSPEFPGARARFEGIADNDLLENNKVSVVVEVENYELGVQTDTPRASEIANSDNGQHVHIIIDNEPYMADYEAGVPFDIGELEVGPHTLVVFPSRSYHESVKSSDAADIVNFYVGEEQGEFMLDESKPTIIYSRPKGEYKGKDAEKIMLDFYLINIDSMDDYQAKYTIRKDVEDAEEYTIIMQNWQPAFITGLTSGEYVVTLQLLDNDGNLVEGAFNNTERTINVVTE